LYSAQLHHSSQDVMGLNGAACTPAITKAACLIAYFLICLDKALLIRFLSSTIPGIIKRSISLPIPRKLKVNSQIIPERLLAW